MAIRVSKNGRLQDLVVMSPDSVKINRGIFVKDGDAQLPIFNASYGGIEAYRDIKIKSDSDIEFDDERGYVPSSPKQDVIILYDLIEYAKYWGPGYTTEKVEDVKISWLNKSDYSAFGYDVTATVFVVLRVEGQETR